MPSVRPPAVAGLFYPADARELATVVDSLIVAGRRRAPAGGAPKALVVPHAGYVHSGATAGLAYATLFGAAPCGSSGVDAPEPSGPRDALAIERVVLLGPCHRVAVRGLALPGADLLATPLGEIPSADAAASGLKGVTTRPDVHAAEHSLEVQLPFLQRVLGTFEVVALAVGDASAGAVADVVDALWGGPETLIVVSTDLSHFHDDATARLIDGDTIARALALDPRLDHRQACGATPLAGLLTTASRRGMRIELLGSATSADASGDRRRVVGYASFGLWEAA